MTAVSSPITVPTDQQRFDDAYRRAREIDLTMVSLKVMHPNIGYGWSAELTGRLADEYRIFFALQAAFPDLWLPPSRILDEFWHNHILDTRAYAEDCQRAAGRFIHHYPYFGMRDADDHVALVDAFHTEIDLYIRCVGQAPPPDLWVTSITVADVATLVAGQYANPAATAAAAMFDDLDDL